MKSLCGLSCISIVKALPLLFLYAWLPLILAAASVIPSILAANSAALAGSSTTAGATPEGVRKEEYKSVPPNFSE